jgi:hypothetical protein
MAKFPRDAPKQRDALVRFPIHSTCVARGLEPFAVSAKGATREEALAKPRAKIASGCSGLIDDGQLPLTSYERTEHSIQIFLHLTEISVKSQKYPIRLKFSTAELPSK